MPMLDLTQIKEIIPHRAPFLLIDEVLEIDPGKHVVARKTVQENEFWTPGHFPGNPVQPGVLTIEMLAQAGAVCVLCLPAHKGKTGFLGGVDKCKFRGMIRPGDEIRLEVDIIKSRSNIGIGKGAAYVGDTRVASAEITFIIQ